MFETFKSAWKIDDLRKKLLYTLFVLFIFRLGSSIPVPFVAPEALKSMISNTGSIFGYLDMISGGSFSKATIMALGVMPFINSSIIIQLLTIAIPALEELSKQGEEGRKKINRISRYTGAGIGVALSIGYYSLLRSQGALSYTTGAKAVFAAVVIVCCFTAGSMLIQWLGEQIDTKGIGNGVSLIIFAGIVSRLANGIQGLMNYFVLGTKGEQKFFFFIPLIIVLMFAVIVLIVILNAAERRIPVQYAKRVVGRKMYGGQSTHIPIKVNMSGVMPVIFASSLVGIPGILGMLLPNLNNPSTHPNWHAFFNMFNVNGFLYAAIYLVLIIGFNYFYVSVQYNPVEIANNLRTNSGTVPGYRPGKPTSDFISKVLSKIVLIGALFLGVVAVAPIILSNLTGVNISLGGTSVLIVVGVAIDVTRSLESYMLMRHHKGFLE